jgi:hypothetical protein
MFVCVSDGMKFKMPFLFHGRRKFKLCTPAPETWPHEVYTVSLTNNLKVGCLHPVACTRSCLGFPSNATLV